MGVIVRWAYLTYNNILCFTKRYYYCYEVAAGCWGGGVELLSFLRFRDNK
jgi:hypothetical protein